MPFTLSHAIVALPFQRASWLVPSAIAAGAMAPDVPLFLPALAPYAATHEFWAAPTIDVVVAYLLLAGWSAFIRVAILALAPVWAAARLPARWRTGTIPIPSVAMYVSLAFGALTHVTWDAFTHKGRLGSQLVPALTTHVGPFALTSLLQYGSSIIGMLVLLWWGATKFRTADRSAPANGRDPLLSPAVRRVAAAVVILLPCAVAAAAAFVERGTGLAEVAFVVLTGSVDTVVVSLAALGIALVARRLFARPSS